MGIAEQYLSATNSTQLAIDAEHACDADKILAAAYATAGDPRRSLALDVYRLRATADMRGARSIAERMAIEVMNKAKPKGRHPTSARSEAATIRKVEAIDLCMAVLQWWHMQTCPACHGRRHPVIPGTPHLDPTRTCSHCNGTGIRPLRKHVKANHLKLAEWIVDALDSLTAIVFSDMLKRLPRFE